MLLRNPAVDESALGALVADRYGADPSHFEFVPVGGDGWHYRCPPFWVSVRRDRQGHDPAAYQAAAELARAGLEFVLAPLADPSGRIVHQLGPFPVVMLPLVEGETLWQSGARPDDAEQVAAMCRRLHAASCATPLSRETYDLPFAVELRDGLAAAAEAGRHCGPYGDPIRALVARNRAAVEAMVAEIEQLAAVCRANPSPLVLTHGEPNTGNVLRDRSGHLHLIDWGELKYGPPERDWSSLDTARPPLREPFARFYQLRWDLGEIAEYTARFAQPHAGNAEDDQMWQELSLYLR